MTPDESFIQQLESYLDVYEGSTPLPDSVRRAVQAEVPRTRQVRPVPKLMRYPPVTSLLPVPIRVGLAAAVVIAIAVVGALFALPGPRDPFGGPVPTPPPASGDPSPSPSPAPSLPAFAAQAAGPLDPGQYMLYAAAYNVMLPRPLSFEIPGGWARFDGQLPALLKGGSEPPGGAGLTFWTVDNVMADPCHPEEGVVRPGVGPTVDDLAAALTEVPSYTATEPTEVTVGGLPATYLELTATDDASDCTDGNLKLWMSSGAQYGQGPTEKNLIWIVDVDGVRLVIGGFHFPKASAATVAELHAMVESITFGDARRP